MNDPLNTNDRRVYTPHPGIEELKEITRELVDKVGDLGDRISIQEAATKDLLEAWINARGFIKSVKWLGSVAIGLSVFYASWKGWFRK